MQLEVLAGGTGRVAETLAASAAPEAPKPLGRLLLERGIVSQEARRRPRGAAVQRSPAGEILVVHGSASWTTVAAVVAEQHGVPQVDVGALREVPAPPPPPPSAAPASAPVYEVREGLRALYRSESFLEATDFAFDHLEANRTS